MRVNEFALGMGPKLFSFQKGETRYSLRLLPIGGFCAMEGEQSESTDNRAFCAKAVWKRMCIIAAGPFCNLLLGFVMMFLVVVQQPAYTSTTVASFQENALTQTHGLQVGDTITAIDGYAVLTARDASYALTMADPNDLSMTVQRDGKSVVLEHMVMPSDFYDGKIYPKVDFLVQPIPKTFGSVLGQTAANTLSYTRMIWSTFVRLITGQLGVQNLAGPVGTVSTIAQVATANAGLHFLDGLNHILLLMVILSINLGVMNFIPFPALDGGRFLFLLIEAIRGKPLPEKQEGWIHAAGFLVLFLFMIFVSFQDIARLFS